MFHLPMCRASYVPQHCETRCYVHPFPMCPPLHCARQAAPDSLLSQGMSPGHEQWKRKSSQICATFVNWQIPSLWSYQPHPNIPLLKRKYNNLLRFCHGGEYWPSWCWWQSWECRLVGNCPAELLTVYIDKAFLQWGSGEDLCGEQAEQPSHVCFHHLVKAKKIALFFLTLRVGWQS